MNVQEYKIDAADAANAAWIRSMDERSTDERSMDATAPSTDAAAAGAGVGPALWRSNLVNGVLAAHRVLFPGLPSVHLTMWVPPP
jgi:hypothetical protein